MKFIGMVQGDIEQARPLVVGKDTVYVHTDIVPITDTLFSYNEIQYDKDEYIELMTQRHAYVNILGGVENWTPEDVLDSNNNIVGTRYGQVVEVKNATITPNSKVDLQLTSEQVVIFQNKALAFSTENDDGVVAVYCAGQIPESNYSIQVTVTEVIINA